MKGFRKSFAFWAGQPKVEKIWGAGTPWTAAHSCLVTYPLEKLLGIIHCGKLEVRNLQISAESEQFEPLSERDSARRKLARYVLKALTP